MIYELLQIKPIGLIFRRHSLFFFSFFVIVIVTVRMQMQFNHENQILRNETYILLETKGLNNERETIFNETNNEI